MHGVVYMQLADRVGMLEEGFPILKERVGGHDVRILRLEWEVYNLTTRIQMLEFNDPARNEMMIHVSMTLKEGSIIL